MIWKDRAEAAVAAMLMTVVVLIVLLLCVWSVRTGETRDRSWRESHRNSLLDQGRRAQRAGVPSTANPLTDSYDRKIWLEGWVEAVEAERSNEAAMEPTR